ncbi:MULTISPECIES: endonuclease/exonuclease/phosphatase family protein [unclassified Streptomyces]|uniref:endonuclease/exonuclease/phosphatase family protein n=1 Tax=unclassified Streptomyces TaxID=2593676 RepID=UPI00214AA824|nr:MULTISPECIES: endonuclease/exonuclease/phosphatase family protein [unclassified Streptomyces]MCX5014219.1 endonuclease/exonuclease/phosphatase family protein [Streptomyces sp. NBC_00555]MCX5608230.1 endonuclease/exonuclease/phosphatase family protein [Streptomyces sp. NBC_00047]UUU42272.1 endonuclease/exonuclease/phosphatase family protein [Streptomyces sp. NBC_00162]
MAQAYMTEKGNGGSEPEPSESRFRRRLAELRGDRGIWRRGLVLAAISVLIALIMIFHAQVPNDVGNLGSLTETFLPWLGLAVPVLLAAAVFRRSATALIAILLTAVVWTNLFGGLVTDKSGSGGNLMVATHNVDADNADPRGTAESVAKSGADVLALTELKGSVVPVYEKALAGAYKYHSVEGTVGVWSRYPLTASSPVDIKMGWTRSMRTTVDTPQGQVAVFVAHLPSVRVKLNAGFTANQRDNSADALGAALAAEPLKKVILLGDLNGTMNDRALSEVTSQMRSTQGAAGDGFGFSWPAQFPMARIDQIMVRGIKPDASWTLPRTSSDHLPIAARLTV